jgi:hypothetical protein
LSGGGGPGGPALPLRAFNPLCAARAGVDVTLTGHLSAAHGGAQG